MAFFGLFLYTWILFFLLIDLHTDGQRRPSPSWGQPPVCCCFSSIICWQRPSCFSFLVLNSTSSVWLSAECCQLLHFFAKALLGLRVVEVISLCLVLCWSLQFLQKTLQFPEKCFWNLSRFLVSSCIVKTAASCLPVSLCGLIVWVDTGEPEHSLSRCILFCNQDFCRLSSATAFLPDCRTCAVSPAFLLCICCLLTLINPVFPSL